MSSFRKNFGLQPASISHESPEIPSSSAIRPVSTCVNLSLRKVDIQSMKPIKFQKKNTFSKSHSFTGSRKTRKNSSHLCWLNCDCFLINCHRETEKRLSHAAANDDDIRKRSISAHRAITKGKRTNCHFYETHQMNLRKPRDEGVR